jgi:hypothetical protein
MSTLSLLAIGRARLRRASIALAISAVYCGAAIAAPTDLAATSVVGAGTTYTDAPTYVTVNVANFGDPLVGSYTIEVVLSLDNAVDASDLVVASVTTSALGAVGIPLSLPVSAPTGLLRWGSRISGVAGEVATGNNQTIGTQVYVQTLDLALEDATPIKFFVRPNDVTTLIAEVNVTNLGTVDSVLVFSIDPLSAAPWLEIDPPSSFVVAGDPSQPIELKALYDGMLPGVYTTTLRFQNFTHPNDFVDLPIELEIGDPKFVPGDRLLGQVATIGDLDAMKFDAIKGMKLGIKFGVKSGDLKPRVEIVDPNGQVEKTLVFSSTKKVKKVAKLKMNGEYTLRVVANDGTSTGGWFARTNRWLPKQGEARVVKVKNPNATWAEVEARLLPGATLDFAVRYNNSFGGPLQLALDAPTTGSYDIAGNIQPTSGNETRVEDVETSDVGSYWIQVGGFGASQKAACKVKILPVQPKRGKAKVYTP